MIETYLDSLPEDTEEINVSNKDISSLDVRRFRKLKILNCSNNQLTILQFNENLEQLNCSYNRLTNLPINENLKILNCTNNYLTILPPLNKQLEIIDCSINRLTTLPALNENLEKLWCNYNQLTTLPPLNENLRQLYCVNNKLTNLPLFNEKLRMWIFYDNPIFDIINTDNKDKINRKIRVLNQFRYLYYSLKFKKRFRDLLWVKIREPKIRERYSHDYLLENLHEETDLDELLENW